MCGSGFVSLAETGKWIKDTLTNFCADADRGLLIYKSFYPSYICAFKDAADVSAKKSITAEASTDDYVQKSEFPFLCAYLCFYAIAFDHFALIDGFGGGDKGADGVGIEGNDDDRRMSREEWDSARARFKGSPFLVLRYAALKKGGGAIFEQMDADGKGKVLLSEFCAWIKDHEIEMGTAYGRLLQVGDE